jgi:hypothetical protein
MLQEEVFIRMVLDAWNVHVKRTDDVINSLSDEDLMKEIAPGRNRGIYLLGHLAAVHDKMLPVLGFGDQMNPKAYQVFVEQADKTIPELPSITDLRAYWNEVNARLATNFNNLTPKDWFQKHNSVSEEDFAREPHRNKLNLVVNRTNHLANHLGQLALLKSKKTG